MLVLQLQKEREAHTCAWKNLTVFPTLPAGERPPGAGHDVHATEVVSMYVLAWHRHVVARSNPPRGADDPAGHAAHDPATLLK